MHYSPSSSILFSNNQILITLNSTESMVSFICGFSCCTQTKEVTFFSVVLLKAMSLFSTSTNNKSPTINTHEKVWCNCKYKIYELGKIIIIQLTRIVRHSKLFSVGSPGQCSHQCPFFWCGQGPHSLPRKTVQRQLS